MTHGFPGQVDLGVEDSLTGWRAAGTSELLSHVHQGKEVGEEWHGQAARHGVRELGTELGQESRFPLRRAEALLFPFINVNYTRKAVFSFF